MVQVSAWGLKRSSAAHSKAQASALSRSIVGLPFSVQRKLALSGGANGRRTCAMHKALRPPDEGVNDMALRTAVLVIDAVALIMPTKEAGCDQFRDDSAEVGFG